MITGASSGIGAGIAAAFAEEGARVIVNYLKSADKAGAVVRRLRQAGGRAVARQADVADKAALDALIRAVLAEFGRIDVWVNNAGADILTGAGAAATDRQKLERLIEINLKGAIAACRAVAPLMQKQGGAQSSIWAGICPCMAWRAPTRRASRRSRRAYWGLPAHSPGQSAPRRG